MGAQFADRLKANPVVAKLRSLAPKRLAAAIAYAREGIAALKKSIQRRKRRSFDALSAHLGKTLLLGNKEDWRRSALETLTLPIRLSLRPLSEETIGLAEIDFILPLLLSEYEVIRASATALGKCLVPHASSVLLANDKLRFNSWLPTIGLGQCVPKMFEADRAFPLIRKKRIDAWGTNSRIFYSESEMRQAGVNLADPDYILQECIGGREEYVTHTISVSGVVTFAATFVNLYDKTMFVKG